MRERGSPGDGAFDRATGVGYVAAVPGDYAHARACGLRVIPLLFETFGGWSPEVERWRRSFMRPSRNGATS